MKPYLHPSIRISFFCMTLQHHSPGGAPATVTCSYIVGWHRWTLGWGNLVQAPQALRHDDTTTRHGDDADTTTTMSDPCSESVPPRGGEGVRRPQALRHDTTTTIRRSRRPAVGNTWAGWGSMPVVFFPGMEGHPCPTLRATSLSLQGEPADIGNR
jgi:hypothetical protein